MELTNFSFHSNLGDFTAILRGEVLISLKAEATSSNLVVSHPLITTINEWVDNRGALSYPIDPEGTLFQKKVWNELQKIPFGETRSYGEVAENICVSGSAQAVGSACGANPILLFIPCHRVLSKTGIGGFSAGLKLKICLLNSEQPHRYESLQEQMLFQ